MAVGDVPEAEPVTTAPPRTVSVPVMRQTWRDVVFLHWETDARLARGMLPAGIGLDSPGGVAHVGVIGLRARVTPLGVLPLPRFGSFAQVNVRLYSVDAAGRRGVVFRSLDAGRLAPVLAGRGAYRLPFHAAEVEAVRRERVVRYAVRRRCPGTAPRRSDFSVEVGERLESPTELDHFLTARWATHWRVGGRTLWCALEHPPWQLHAAQLLACSDELVAAAGLPSPTGRPVSVLWSPGLDTRVGAPRTVSS